MKVIHLPYGAGISTLSRALRNQGIEATSCSLNAMNIYHYLADIRLNLFKYNNQQRDALRKELFKESLKKYDIFHFHFGETFFPDKSDLKILKQRGKKMIVEHRGSDVRMLSVAKKFNNPYVRVKDKWPEKKIRANLKMLSTYIDHAIVPDLELLPYIKPYYKKIHIVPRVIDASQFTPQYPSPHSLPLIVHAPSQRELKGTEFLVAVVKRLKREGYKFEFRLIEKLPHGEAMKQYQRATIVVDQLLIGSYGNLSMEAMAMGKPAVCFIRDDLRNSYPPELPIVNANPDTIYDVLKDLLDDTDRWGKLGKEGRRYVEQHHSLERSIHALIEIYNELYEHNG